MVKTNIMYSSCKIFFLSAFMVLALASCSKKEGGVNASTKDTTAAIKYIDTLAPSTAMKHTGGLHISADFDRIKAKLAVNAEPWLSGWNKLIANSHAQLSYNPNPVEKLIRGGSSAEEPEPDNYSRAMNDVAAAYQLALRWKITDDDAYATKAVQILNAWASVCKRISGNSNTALAAGIYGYQFAIAGELLRNYPGWSPEDFSKYKQWMLDVFYSLNNAFLNTHWGTCNTHYWANWDLANLASVMAIGILTDNRQIYNQAVNYLQRGHGNGNLLKAIYYVHPEGLGQIQESGRDQGHATLCIALVGTICELAWNQGDDFYGFDDNRFLKACEYAAKYNVARLSVPFKEYVRRWSHDCREEIHTAISDFGRGTVRPMWDLPYNHYVKRKGMAAAYTQMAAGSVRSEGGGGDYGPNSGGFDQLGFGTLLYTLD
jgi:hypothetical protein